MILPDKRIFLPSGVKVRQLSESALYVSLPLLLCQGSGLLSAVLFAVSNTRVTTVIGVRYGHGRIFQVVQCRVTSQIRQFLRYIEQRVWNLLRKCLKFLYETLNRIGYEASMVMTEFFMLYRKY